MARPKKGEVMVGGKKFTVEELHELFNNNDLEKCIEKGARNQRCGVCVDTLKRLEAVANKEFKKVYG